MVLWFHAFCCRAAKRPSASLSSIQSVEDLSVGQVVNCSVKRVEKYGLFCWVEGSRQVVGLAHISELRDGPVKDITTDYKPKDVSAVGLAAGYATAVYTYACSHAGLALLRVWTAKSNISLFWPRSSRSNAARVITVVHQCHQGLCNARDCVEDLTPGLP